MDVKPGLSITARIWARMLKNRFLENIFEHDRE
jgi:hypothetical protein